MLHYLQISKIAEKLTKAERYFSLTYCKPTGELKELSNLICTSSHFRPASINIQTTTGAIKKLRCCNIIKFNEVEISI